MAAVARALGWVAIVEDHGLHEEAEADRAAADPTTHTYNPMQRTTEIGANATHNKTSIDLALDSERTANKKRVGPKRHKRRRREPNGKQRKPNRKR